MLAFLLALLMPRVASPTSIFTGMTHIGGISVLHSWQVLTPFQTSDVLGVANGQCVFIGEVANTDGTIIPTRADGGRHYTKP